MLHGKILRKYDEKLLKLPRFTVEPLGQRTLFTLKIDLRLPELDWITLFTITAPKGNINDKPNRCQLIKRQWRKRIKRNRIGSNVS